MDWGCREASALYPTSIKDDQLRLVVLNRARHWKDDISCELHTERLLGKRPPAYKALSYAWGSTKTRHTITVNEMSVEVTVNLESALRHIRQPDRDAILWIEALCINQADNTERGLQVANMCEIYRAATEVIVFLGNGKHHRIQGHSSDQFPGPQVVFDHSSSDEALVSQFLERWGTPAPRSAQALDVISLLRLLASPHCDSLKPVEPLNNMSDACLATLFEALRMMMRCPWWDRMWVVQEIIVAKKVTFQYGRVSAPWSALTAAAFAHMRLDSLPHEYKTVLGLYSRRVIDIEHRRATWREHRKTALLSLLREFSDRGASDDRDKIFALLGLCSESTLVVPDYSLEFTSTYILATLDAICTTRTLSVLNGDLGRKNRQDLPSWVPDWSATFDEHDRRRADLFDGIYNACKEELSCVSSSHGSWGPRVWQMYSSRHRDRLESHVSRQLGYLLDSLLADKNRQLLLPPKIAPS